VVSPLTPGPSLSDMHTFELFAEIGVVLLMFSIGIEFSLHDLLRVKWVAIVGGPLGIVLSTALGLAVGAVLGWPPVQGLIVGMVVSVASTMVMARLLIDRGELHSRHGRVMIGITLVEDLAVVVLIVLIPTLGDALSAGRLLAVGRALLTAAVVLVPFVYLAAKVVPRLLERVARTRSDELFLLVTLALGLGTAALTQAVGLSLALGAFLAGLMISGSDYAHHTLARLLPLRDVFVALFFVTVGALVDPSSVIANPGLLATIVALVVVGKLVIWTAVVRIFRYPLATALTVAVGLTQIGEFSFILIQVARQAGHVGDDVYNATLAASLITILINAALVRTVPRWIGRARLARAARDEAAAAPRELSGHILLCGFGRVGSAVAEAFDTFGRAYVVIETDPEIVKGLRARGIPCVYGDAASRPLLEAAGAARAALVVIALPEVERVHQAVAHVRMLNPDAPILARAHESGARARLIAEGASEVIQPELEAAATLIRHVLRRLDLPRDAVLDYLERFRGAMDVAGDVPTEALPGVQSVVIGHGGLADQSLREARIRERFGVTVISVDRVGATRILHPSAETVVRTGDTVRVFGLPDQIAAFAQAAAGG